MCRLNPTRMGVPKRSSSLNKQVDAFVKEHGGDRPIYRSVHVLGKVPHICCCVQHHSSCVPFWWQGHASTALQETVQQ